MRNLKRVLALALALVMVIGMMVMGASAAEYTDAESINDAYTEAVGVMSGLGMFKGDDNGNLNPTGTVTRAQAAVMMARLKLGQTAADNLIATKQIFSDVPLTAETEWYAAEVEYCYQTGLIAGNDKGEFNPGAEIDGLGFAKLLLVAMGYKADVEGYVGSDWSINIAVDAQANDLLVKGVVLTDKLTREVAAQMLFQALDEGTVYYISGNVIGSVGYFSTGKTFADTYYGDLEKVEYTTADIWGRPYEYQWKLDGEAIYSVLAEKLASYVEPAKNCQIYDDTGLDEDEVLDVWTNGVKAEDAYTVADSQTKAAPTAQGRLVEVYEDRLVVIDTYLAKVASTTAAYTDALGHVTPATATFSVYDPCNTHNDCAFAVVEVTDAYTVGQYALVNVYAGGTTLALKNIQVTTPVAAGAVMAYTTSTTTVGATTYKDAYKFELENDNTGAKKVDAATAWNVFVDNYGNIIGMVKSATNYLVVEKIEWKHAATIGGGYALADIVLATGERIQGVTIASVNGTPVKNADYYNGDADTATVADSYVNNTAANSTGGKSYYGHIFTYTVNADGSYAIGAAYGHTGDLTDAYIYSGFTTIKGNTNSIVANDKTVFLVKNAAPADAYTYTAYVGKNNVPSLDDADICYLTGTNGYATLAVVTAYALPSNTFVAYVSDNASSELAYVGGAAHYVHKVWKAGEATATVVYGDNATLITSGQDGFYQITVDNKGEIVSASSVWFMGTYDNGAAGTAGSAYATYSWDRTFYKILSGNSMETVNESNAAFADYNVDDAVYFVVNQNLSTNVTTVRGGSSADLAAGDKLIVAYKTVTYGSYSFKDAAYVYIIRSTQNATLAKATYATIAAGWGVQVNNVSVVEGVRYTTDGVNDTDAKNDDALKAAVANATELKLSTLTAVGSNEYTIKATSNFSSKGDITVYQTSAQIPTTLTADGTNQSGWTGTLAVGNYIVIADIDGDSDVFYAVYKVVE